MSERQITNNQQLILNELVKTKRLVDEVPSKRYFEDKFNRLQREITLLKRDMDNIERKIR